MKESDFITDNDTLYVKVYDGTMCGNAPHYNVKELITVNTRLVKEKDLLFEYIISIVMKTGIYDLPRL